MSGSGRPGGSGGCWPGSPAPRGGLEQAERERTWALVSARAEGISIRTLATAAGLSPSRVHQLVAGADLDALDAALGELRAAGWPAHVRRTTPQTNQLQVALGDRSSCGLFAQDWTGVSNPALLKAPQSIQRPTSGPGI